jgi:Patatin-like phospholipase
MDILGIRGALCQELDEIDRRRQHRPGGAGGGYCDDLETHEQRAGRLSLSALCLSGGGLRGAAFCLGALQALASKGLLRQFDYVSTVSGGGLIGGWLQMLIREAGGVAQAETVIRQPRPSVLQRLRAYISFLVPRTGLLSTDTWAEIVLYLRNLLINWLLFAPLFLMIALIPIFYRTAIWAVGDVGWVNVALLVCAGLALLFGTFRASTLLPSHRPPRSYADPSPAYADADSIRWGIVYPTLCWIMVVPWPLYFALGAASERPWLVHHVYWTVPVVYAALTTLGFGLAWWTQSARADPGSRLSRANFGRWTLASIGSALLLWFMLRVAGSTLALAWPAVAAVSGEPLSTVRSDVATMLAVLAPLALATMRVVQTSLYVAFMRETAVADLDRAWLARLDAMVLRTAVGWAVFAVCILVLPVAISAVDLHFKVELGPFSSEAPLSIRLTQSDGVTLWSGASIVVATVLTMLVGGVAAWLTRIWPLSAEIGEKESILRLVWQLVQAYLPAALCVVFIVSYLIVFGAAIDFVLARLQIAVGNALQLNAKAPARWLPLVLQVLVGAMLFAAVLTFRHVNVNRFSMNAVYRGRLSRAFLGSARNERQQDPFTGFDAMDNIPLSALLYSADSLFPVVNMTLNITAGSYAAVGSFTATPLACGAAVLRHPGQAGSSPDPDGAFVPTTRFAGLESLRDRATRAAESGLGLGSVLTVSGAAASARWGYHPSRITAFLMTLFNMRLGIWLPNPSIATADELRLARPRNSLRVLLDELLDTPSDERQAIYLSDGRHFEGLGLYEMLRRRCSSIVVVDANVDPDCTLFGLGNAIRQADVDLGITVKMREPMHIHPRTQIEANSVLAATALGFALGDIDYGSGHAGQLLYLKPSFLPAIPTDVRSYATAHRLFPHELTLDQRFGDRQFESYRMLGLHQMAEAVGHSPVGDLQQAMSTAAVLSAGAANR